MWKSCIKNQIYRSFCSRMYRANLLMSLFGNCPFSTSIRLKLFLFLLYKSSLRFTILVLKSKSFHNVTFCKCIKSSEIEYLHKININCTTDKETRTESMHCMDPLPWESLVCCVFVVHDTWRSRCNACNLKVCKEYEE